jgi:hypothetical protein
VAIRHKVSSKLNLFESEMVHPLGKKAMRQQTNSKHIRVLNSEPHYEDTLEGGGINPRVLNLGTRCRLGGCRFDTFLCMMQNLEECWMEHIVKIINVFLFVRCLVQSLGGST